MKTTVIYHRADFDGLFCREIARKFIPAAEFIGWDFADKPLEIPQRQQVIILDLPVDRVFGVDYANEYGISTAEVRAQTPLEELERRLIWIDHHKSSIESHPPSIPGYRIDGVAACRLAWQWFANLPPFDVRRVDWLPKKKSFIDREVLEPLAVRLAGEYDIWDKRDPDAEVFQFGLRSQELTAHEWDFLLDATRPHFAAKLVTQGLMLQRYQQKQNAGLMERSAIVQFEGLTFLALNTARCNSLTFAAKDVPETGHDGLLAFYWCNGMWNVSLYHARHRTDIDLSAIAIRRGGGGHRGACGFRAAELPFLSAIQPAEVV